MEFIYPNFLWALFAILIPIIIHLFYFKRFKKVYFSNTRFLKEIKEETTNKNKLKNLLVLLSRISTIIFLVFAFAQPFIPQGKDIKKGTKGASIYIDNSFSMQALSEEAPLIEKAKKKAKEIVSGFPNDSKFQILTNKLYGSEQKWLNKENAISIIEKIKLTPTVKTLKNISAKQKQAFVSEGIDNKYIFWLSDFQSSVFNIDSSDLDTAINYNLVLLQSIREKNISIDSCFWDKPIPVKDQTNNLFIKISNYSDQSESEIPVNLFYNNQVYPAGKVDLKANSSTIDTVNVRINTQGWSSAKINIKDYPITFDDDYFIAFNIPDRIKILNINSTLKPNKYLKAAFDDNNLVFFDHSSINQVDYSSLNTFDLIILEDIKNISSGLKTMLKKAINSGTNIILFPSENADIKSLNEFLTSVNANNFVEFRQTNNEANNLNINEFVFKNVYDKINKNITPVKVKGSYKSTNFQTKNAYHIIKFKNGESFIDRYKFGLGNIFISTSPFSEQINNLCKNPEIFVPLIFNMSLVSDSEEKNSFIIGKDNSINIQGVNTGEKNLFTIKGQNLEFIPKQINIGQKVNLDVADQIKVPGIYEILQKGKLIKKVAFNYDRRESELTYLDENGLKTKLSKKVKIYGLKNNKINFTKEIESLQNGIQLWKLFLILALIFLAIEILLLKLFKNK